MDQQEIARAVAQIPKEFYYVTLVAVIWFVRLEALVKFKVSEYDRRIAELQEKLEFAEKDHNIQRDKIWEKIETVQNSLNAVLQALGRVEGKLDTRQDNRA
jgi:hypothetical protein